MKFEKELKQRIEKECEIPEKLSAENIEKLINEKGAIDSPKIKAKKKVPVIKIAASLAAVFAICIALYAGGTTLKSQIEKSRYDIVIENKVEANKTQTADYSKLEAAVLTKFKNVYDTQKNANNGIDLFIYKNSASDDGFVEESAADTNGASGTTLQSSKTNTQVSGVDEADFIKNDGRYIYYICGEDIVITDCQKPDNMKVCVKKEFDEKTTPQEMFLSGDTLIVICRRLLNEYPLSRNNYDNGFMLYGCCVFLQYDTVVYVYDVNNKSNPALIDTFTLSGNYISSRLVNDKLIVASNYGIPYSQSIGKDFEESCDTLLDNMVPAYTLNGGEVTKINPQDITLVNEESPESYVITAMYTLGKKGSISTNAILAGGYEMYMTSDELYITECFWNAWTIDGYDDNKNMGDYDRMTYIHKFNLTDEGVKYERTGQVFGGMLNQFSIDKYGDYLRIATNVGMTNDGKTFNSVFVLDNKLECVGKLTSIAVGEQIKSARFMGDTCYIVTFKNTDPLFVIDLSDAKNPTIKGELKIPGFSEYLHPISDSLLIGVGYGGDEDGLDGSAKVSLFDVSDPFNPTEIDNLIIKEADLDTSHKAFVKVSENSFMLSLIKYKYNVDEYKQESQIAHISVKDNKLVIENSYSAVEGDNSWLLLRGAFIGNTAFAVSTDGIASYDMTTGKKVGEVRF